MLIKKRRIPLLHMLCVGILPSFIKKMVYRAKGCRIGKGVSLSFGSVILGRKVEIGDHCKVGFFTIIRGREISIGRFVKIGSLSVIDTEKIFIGEDSRINEQVYIGGMKTPQSSFHMGKRCIIMQLSYLNPTLPIFIDDDSGIGGHCLLFTHGSWNSQLEGFPVKFAPIHLGKKVWLPWRVFIMPGVSIGDNVVVGANSMINSDLPSNCVAAGSPAKIIRENATRVPDRNKHDELLQNIFDEFFEYLRYENFSCDVSKEENGFIATVQGKKSGAIHYVIAPLMHIKGDSGSVIIFDTATPEVLQEAIQSGYGMAVSINSGTRIGSNASGEELIAFFSRYGVRFARMD